MVSNICITIYSGAPKASKYGLCRGDKDEILAYAQTIMVESGYILNAFCPIYCCYCQICGHLKGTTLFVFISKCEEATVLLVERTTKPVMGELERVL